jgi:hypothetical protein
MQIIPHLPIHDIAKYVRRSFQSISCAHGRNWLAAAARKLTIANQPDILLMQKCPQVLRHQ